MNALAKYLSDKKMTQAEFARQVDESPQSIGRYVKGDRIPEEDVMRKIFLSTNGIVDANGFYELNLSPKKRRTQ